MVFCAMSCNEKTIHENIHNSTIKHTVGNFITTCNIVPKDLNINTNNDILKKGFNNPSSRSLNIVFSIEPNADRLDKSDILINGQQSWAEYSKRIEQFNFSMEENFEIVYNGKTIPSAIVLFENYYGLKNKLVFNVAFALEDEIQGDFEIIYRDKFFDLGNVYFYYNISNLLSFQSIQFKTPDL